jgi:rubredoxin
MASTYVSSICQEAVKMRDPLKQRRTPTIVVCYPYFEAASALDPGVWMVNELERKIGTVFQCELCGYGYRDLDTAEQCEEYCDTHGACSREITKKSIYTPSVRVMSANASH